MKATYFSLTGDEAARLRKRAERHRLLATGLSLGEDRQAVLAEARRAEAESQAVRG